jgi:hypothetical protein
MLKPPPINEKIWEWFAYAIYALAVAKTILDFYP